MFFAKSYYNSIALKSKEELMNYKIVNGAISFGADTILEEINFEIKDKDKIAIVGRNGSGTRLTLMTYIK